MSYDSTSADTSVTSESTATARVGARSGTHSTTRWSRPSTHTNDDGSVDENGASLPPPVEEEEEEGPRREESVVPARLSDRLETPPSVVATPAIAAAVAEVDIPLSAATGSALPLLLVPARPVDPDRRRGLARLAVSCRSSSACRRHSAARGDRCRDKWIRIYRETK